MGIHFEHPALLVAGLPMLVAVLAWTAIRLRGFGVAKRRVWILTACRGLALGFLLALLARPFFESNADLARRRDLVVLLDDSRSMGLAVPAGVPAVGSPVEGRSRYARAQAFIQEELTPALAEAGLSARSFVFSEDAVLIESGVPRDEADGARTDLAGALVQTVRSAGHPPLAVIALTDGAANVTDSNRAALQSLLEADTPFIGVGYGSDLRAPSLGIERLDAPSRVAPNERFALTVELQLVSDVSIPDFELVLTRDGKFVQSKPVRSDSSGMSPEGDARNGSLAGSRYWTETFELIESEEGLFEYSVELRAPAVKGLIATRTKASWPVHVGKGEEFRVLFVQGALTWDFKFIRRALRGDSALRLTALSRTSEHSVFRQDIESADELSSGFPQSLKDITPYRVVAISELKPSELSREQQELISKFVSELGGGLLVLGGESTFDASWRGSTLEKLLPVTFDEAMGVSGLDRPFRMELTEEAHRSPVFQISDDGSSRELWSALPLFTQYGRVHSEKPGAMVWARHSEDRAGEGRRILMASQYYGSGVSAVLTVQNLWRWRLAKGSDPARFDRFWQQLFRHLGQTGRPEIAIQLDDQMLATGETIRFSIERVARPEHGGDARTGTYTVRVRSPEDEWLVDQKVDLTYQRPLSLSFDASAEGLYRITASRPDGAPVTKPVEIRDGDVEMERTARQMDTLSQWAEVSDGLAFRAEELVSGAGFVERIRDHVIERRVEQMRQNTGVNLWVLTLVVGLLGCEWALRRIWSLK